MILLLSYGQRSYSKGYDTTKSSSYYLKILCDRYLSIHISPMLNTFQWSCNTCCILPIAHRFFFLQLLQPSSEICLQSKAGLSLLHSTYCRKVLVSGLFFYSHQDVPHLSKAQYYIQTIPYFHKSCKGTQLPQHSPRI